MRRVGWAVPHLAIWLQLVAPLASAGERSTTTPDAARVLGDWHRRASSVTTIEAKFRMTKVTRGGGETRSEGRVVLALPNLAQFDETTLEAGAGRPASRSMWTWTGNDVLFFMHDSNRVYRFRYREEWSVPPAPLSLPFLFGMDVKLATRLYDWTLMGEGPDRLILEASPRGDARDPFESIHFVIDLDKTTYLPRKVVLIQGDRGDREKFFLSAGVSREIYELIDVRQNAPVDRDELKAPCLDAWSESNGWSFCRFGGWLDR